MGNITQMEAFEQSMRASKDYIDEKNGKITNIIGDLSQLEVSGNNLVEAINEAAASGGGGGSSTIDEDVLFSLIDEIYKEEV